MRMVLKLKDKTEYSITENEAEKITEMLTQKLDWIKLGAEMISRTMVAGIFEDHSPPMKIPDFDLPLLEEEAKGRCRGQYSIQLEVNNIAQIFDNWGELIGNKGWRQQTRDTLRETTDVWCDFKTGDCHCEDDYLSAKNRMTNRLHA